MASVTSAERSTSVRPRGRSASSSGVGDLGDASAPRPSPTGSSSSQGTRGAADVRVPPAESLSPPNPNHGHTQRRSWKRRFSHTREAPGLKWPPGAEGHAWENGRVLLMDYISSKPHDDGKRRIVSQEVKDMEGLRRFYAKQQDKRDLRVIHVQNAAWATHFLLKKFNITSGGRTDFGTMARMNPQVKAGKPSLQGKVFPTQRDPWRGISRAAFGLDYLKTYDAGHSGVSHQQNLKMMELNTYDEDEMPFYSTDVFVQRISVYLQVETDDFDLPPDLEISNTDSAGSDSADADYTTSEYGTFPSKLPDLDRFDNGSTLIVFETSLSGSTEDTVISARGPTESRWRRLPFYVSAKDASNDESPTTTYLTMILQDVFKGLVAVWEDYISACGTHVSILEDKFYQDPTDGSRAPELWSMINLFLKVEKLFHIHLDIIKDWESGLTDLLDDSPACFETSQNEYEKLHNLLQADLINPTNNISEQMYKSVAFRDSRDSLRFSASLWRLSWITFIFLPLNFVNGFFGMNVDTFAGFPSVGYYFITAVVFMLVVFAGWSLTKHLLLRSRRFRNAPYARRPGRGVYEMFYHDLAKAHPGLWSRSGPREDVLPDSANASMLVRLKWYLLHRWFAPQRVRTRTMSWYGEAGGVNLGAWDRFKQWCARRWLDEMHASSHSAEVKA